MAASATDYFQKVGRGTATTLSAPGYTTGVSTSINVGSTSNWPTDTGITFAIDETELSGGEYVRTDGTYNVYRGTVNSATQITNVTWVGGDGDRNYSAGATTRVYILVTSARDNRLVDGLLVSHDQDGTLKAGAVDVTAVVADSILTKAKLDSSMNTELNTGWITGVLPSVSSVTANGNRSYDVVFGSTVASTLSPGMRLRTTRTAAAPQTAFSLDGANDYYSKTSPTGLSFTTTFTCSAWVYLTAYQLGYIINRRNADTEGWSFRVAATGQLELSALRIAANNKSLQSYQSIPLNRWVHVAATMDVAVGDTTAQKIWIDGVEVPRAYTLTGTATALVQGTSALAVGARSDGTSPFAGYIDQAAVFSSQLSDATIKGMISQGLTGSESGLVSAYSNGSTTDLSANANNLTAQNGATTVANSPFGNRGTSSTLDYALVMNVSTTTATVQVPEGCTIPTTGGVSAVAYSTQASPYGFVGDGNRWRINSLLKTAQSTTSNATYGSFISDGWALKLPVGAWKFGWQAVATSNVTTSTSFNVSSSTSIVGTTVTAGHDISPYTQRILPPSAASQLNTFYVTGSETTSTQKTFIMYSIGATTGVSIGGTAGTCEIFAEINYL